MIIFYFIVNSLVIMGVHFCFQNGQIFGVVGDWVRDRPQLKPFFKPIFICYICMSSVWGTAGYWLYAGDSVDGWIIYIFALTGFMYLIQLTFFND